MNTATNKEVDTIFAFDMGLASLGIAVCKKDDICFAKSYLLDADTGSVKEQRIRRTALRTRKAHKAREKWLEQVWCDELKLDGYLQGRRQFKKNKQWQSQKGDEKLEREFAKSGDNTIYTSSLLRIQLLQNKKLQHWQIYKAIRSAIQRRGYDLYIPWRVNEQNKEDAFYVKSLNHFAQQLQAMTTNKDYHYPCYWDAYCMGLWEPKNNTIKLQQDHTAQRARQYTASRELVEKEIYHLLQSAAKQIPALANKIGYLMYGEKGEEFLPLYQKYLKDLFRFQTQHNKDFKKMQDLRYPYETEHAGILAQKHPRFDNRIVYQCVLMPYFHVCRAKELLSIQCTYLLKLKNMRYYDSDNKLESLNPEDIRQLFNTAKEKARKQIKNKQEIQSNYKALQSKIHDGLLKSRTIAELLEKIEQEQKLHKESKKNISKVIDKQLENMTLDEDENPDADTHKKTKSLTKKEKQEIKNTVKEKLKQDPNVFTEEIRQQLTFKIDSTILAKLQSEAIFAQAYQLTKSDWKKWLLQKSIGKEGCSISTQYEVVEKANTSGRSRFSRPSLYLLKELILSGKNPHDFHVMLLKALNNKNTKENYFYDLSFTSKVKKFQMNNIAKNQKLRGLEQKDLDFLLAMPNDWQKINVVAKSLAQKYIEDIHPNQDQELSLVQRQLGIKKILTLCRNPVVRHRVQLFCDQLEILITKYGKPDRIVMEFVREDFLSEKKKKDYEAFANKNRKENDEAKKQAKEIGITQGMDLLRVQLLRKQHNICMYTGETLTPSKISTYEIDHIIPQALGGPDAIWNKVLTTRDTNQEKTDKIPYDFIQPSNWKSFVERVNGKKHNLGKRTIKLLQVKSIQEAKESLEHYYGLATTSWIARLARDVACLRLGWQPAEKGEAQHFHIISGGLTAKIRRRYDLNLLLGDYSDKTPEELREIDSEDIKKDRTDKRHHALDAMVLVYLSTWYRSNDKQKYFSFPKNISKTKVGFVKDASLQEKIAQQKRREKRNQEVRAYFKKHLDEVFPTFIGKNKNDINQSIYAKIKRPFTVGTKESEQKGDCIAVITKPMTDVLQIEEAKKEYDKKLKETSDPKKAFASYQATITKRIDKQIIDQKIQEQLRVLLKACKNPKDFQEKVVNLRQAKNKGSHIKKMRIKAQHGISVMKNLAKDQSARGQYFESKSVTGIGVQQHGIYICKKNDQYEAKPVYAFQSPYLYKKQLQEQGYEVIKNRLFTKNMMFLVVKDIKIVSKKIPKGEYHMYKIGNKQFGLKNRSGKEFNGLLVCPKSSVLFFTSPNVVLKN